MNRKMPKEKTVYAWEKDSCAKTWISGLKASSVELYKGRFNDWIEFIGLTPKQQIDKRIRDLQSTNPKVRNYFEDKLIEYKNRLEVQGYT
jgi:hypothetical protein